MLHSRRISRRQVVEAGEDREKHEGQQPDHVSKSGSGGAHVVFGPVHMSVTKLRPVRGSVYLCFFRCLLAGFLSPVLSDIIFFISLNCCSVKMVRISFMAVSISS